MAERAQTAWLVPVVIEQNGRGERAYDIYSRLFRDRIILIDEPIDDTLANLIIAELLYLEGNDPNADISIYINSPGGSATACLAVVDTIRFIKPDVNMFCVGQAASVAAVVLSAGTKGKRFALPNSRVVIHQPLGGVAGQASDIHIHARELLRIRELLNRILAETTGQDAERIAQDTDRDYIMTASMAKDYGIIDEVLHERH